MYEDFKKRCLRDSVIAKRLHMVYGSGDNLDTRLDLENINKRVCLHAEMNILNEIINQRIKTREFPRSVVTYASCILNSYHFIRKYMIAGNFQFQT